MIIRTSIKVLSIALLVVACSDDNNNNNGGPDGGGGDGGGSGSGGKGTTTGGSSGKGGTGGGTAGAGGSKGGTGGGTAGAGGSTGGTKPSTGGGAGDSGVPDGGPDGSTDGGDGGPGNPPVPTLGAVIDRMGRPAIATALIAVFETNATTKGNAKNAYNSAAESTWQTFVPEFEKNLGLFDALDNVCKNQLLYDTTKADLTAYARLAGALSDDKVYLNTGVGACTQYLAVEAVMATDCGGRAPSYDVIKTSLSALVAGTFTGLDDTITADDGVQTTTFPFLGAPIEPADAGDAGN